MAWRGKSLSPEHRAKIAKANTGKHHSEETKEKIRIARKKQVITEDQKKRTSLSVNRYWKDHSHPHKGRTLEAIFGEKRAKEINQKRGKSVSQIQLGKKFPEWRKKLMSRVLTGRKSWKKGLSKETDERVLRQAKATSEGVKQRWKDKKYQEKQMQAQSRKPNKWEQEFAQVFPQLRFTGDLRFFVGSRNPDFNLPNTNKCIDLFGEYWHTPDEPDKRMEYFIKRGYELLIIWQRADWMKNKERTIENVAEFLEIPLVNIGR